MTRTRGVVKASREPVASPRKPVSKEYGAKGEYAMTAYERRRLERKGFLPTGDSLPPAQHPGSTDRRADSPSDAAGYTAGGVPST